MYSHYHFENFQVICDNLKMNFVTDSYNRMSNQQKEFTSNIINGEKRVKFESNVEHFNLKSDDKNISINLNFNI